VDGWQVVRLADRLVRLWASIAVLVELPLVVGQQVKHRLGLLLAKMIIESRAWLGVLDVDDDLGVVPNGRSYGFGPILLVMWFLHHESSPGHCERSFDSTGSKSGSDQSRTRDGSQDEVARLREAQLARG
jgi:hypothetical protein